MTVDGFWAQQQRDTTWRCESPSADAIAFHLALPGYAPTPLVDLPTLAAELGIGRLVAKDESLRLGLPAFKALGASWAIARMLQGMPDATDRLFVTATDGNHGRAVARFSRALGHRARIFIPAGVHPAAVQAIADEGGDVVEVGGTYDEAVQAAASAAAESGALLVQDMAWDGYEEVPGWIVEGYATLFAEVDERLAVEGSVADLAVVPAGVGSLLQGALAHYRGERTGGATRVMSVEPDSADCVRVSLNAGRMVAVETGTTVMAGLNCGTVSTLAWPYIAAGLDASVAVSDETALAAMADLAALGVMSGPCGGAGLAGLRRALTGSGADERRAHLGVDGQSTVVILVTEGRDANPAGT